jgi:hypothetical protein
VPEGISHKLRRANQHLEALYVEAQEFLKADPEPCRIVSHDDPDSRDRIYQMEILKPPPALDWAIVTGEILYNLVSALDHLAWELCLAHAPARHRHCVPSSQSSGAKIGSTISSAEAGEKRSEA